MILNLFKNMNETIREQQISWLKNSLRTALFNATLHRSSQAGRPMELIAVDKQWFLTDEDLTEVFSADGRGITAHIEGEKLLITKPIKQ